MVGEMSDGEPCASSNKTRRTERTLETWTGQQGGLTLGLSYRLIQVVLLSWKLMAPDHISKHHRLIISTCLDKWQTDAMLIIHIGRGMHKSNM